MLKAARHHTTQGLQGGGMGESITAMDSIIPTKSFNGGCENSWEILLPIAQRIPPLQTKPGKLFHYQRIFMRACGVESLLFYSAATITCRIQGNQKPQKNGGQPQLQKHTSSMYGEKGGILMLSGGIREPRHWVMSLTL